MASRNQKKFIGACNWNFVFPRKATIWNSNLFQPKPVRILMEGSQSLGKPLKTRPTANSSLNKELRKYGRNNPQMHRLQLSYLTTPKQKRTKISDICKTFLSSSDNENTSRT